MHTARAAFVSLASVASLALLPADIAAAAPMPPGCPKAGGAPALATVAPSVGDAQKSVRAYRGAQAKLVAAADLARWEAFAATQRPKDIANLAVGLATMGQATVARALAADAAALLPQDGRAWANVGAFMAQDEEADADQVLRYAEKLESRNPAPIANLAYIAFNRGAMADAERLFEQAVSLSATFKEAHLGLAAIALCKGEQKRYEAELAKARTPLTVVRRKTAAQRKEDHEKASKHPDPFDAPAAAGDREAAFAERSTPPGKGRHIGSGVRHDFDPPPSFGDYHQAIPNRNKVAAYAKIASEIHMRESELSSDYAQRVYQPRHSAGDDWTAWRLNQLTWADGQLTWKRTDLRGAEAKLAQAQNAAVAARKPNAQGHQATIDSCQSHGTIAQINACVYAVQVAYCDQLKAEMVDRWTTGFGRWSAYTAEWIKLSQWFYFTITDAVFRSPDVGLYQASVAKANAEAWRILGERADALVVLIGDLTPELLIDKPDWCVAEKLPSPDDAETEAARTKKTYKIPIDWCPESLQASLDTPLGALSVGCKEVGIKVKDGFSTASVSYDFKKGELTGYIGIGPKVSIAGHEIGAELGAEVIANSSGIKDVAFKASASAGDAAKLQWRASAEGERSASIKLGENSLSTKTTTSGAQSAVLEIQGQTVTRTRAADGTMVDEAVWDLTKVPPASKAQDAVVDEAKSCGMTVVNRVVLTPGG